MTSTTTMRRFVLALLALLAAVSGCSKRDATNDEAARLGSTVEHEGTAKAGPETLIAQIGVEPGPVQRAGFGDAALVRVAGTVEVRALGEEVFKPISGNRLYAGDQVRVGERASALLVFPDDTTLEIAELSTVAIGSRVTGVDPASSAAVLSGVARLSVSPRAKGEGPFVVFTPAGVIATKGTVFAVGVTADGDARVGVEHGSVDVAGAVAFASPVSVEANQVVELEAEGKVGAPVAWTEDDWGTWRDNHEAEIDVAATADAHVNALAALTARLLSVHAELEALATQVAKFEGEASAHAEANASAEYQAKLSDAGASIEASFLAGLHLEWLTQAFAARALLASEFYARHPDVVVAAKVEPLVQASVLWTKRFDASAALYLEPMRMHYYVHTLRGRAQAKFVGLTVPSFYARVTPPDVPLAKVRGKLSFEACALPEAKVTASTRAVFLASPDVEWRGHVSAQAAASRGRLGFWLRPPVYKAKATLGAKAKAELEPTFAAKEPGARGELKGKVAVVLGQKLKLDPPDMQAALKARSGEAKAKAKASTVAAAKAKGD